MTEGKTQTHTLEDTTERAFALFTQWVYTQKLDIRPKDTRSPITVTSEGEAFFELWVLADKLLVRSLQNLTIDLIHKMNTVHNMVWTSEIKYTYENTSLDSPLRRLLIDQVASLGEESQSMCEHIHKRSINGPDLRFKTKGASKYQRCFSRHG